MSGILSNGYFYVLASVAIGSAIATVSVRSPLRAAMALLLHILTLAGLYLSLHAQVLAAIQLLVYAGAVVVLFVFVIMLFGPRARVQGTTRGLITRSMSAAALLLIAAALAFSLAGINPSAGVIAVCDERHDTHCTEFGGVKGLSREIFGAASQGIITPAALVPFELVSILLLVAVVGAITVARGRTRAEAKELEARKSTDAAGSGAQLGHVSGTDGGH